MTYDFFTEKGLAELGRVIERSRKRRGLSLRDAANFISSKLDPAFVKDISHGTLSRVEHGYGEAKYNTLVAIAVSGLVIDNNGRPLTKEEFFSIASESNNKPIKKMNDMASAEIELPLSRKIEIAMNFYRIRQDELEERFANRKSPATISKERLREIQGGAIATRVERQLIYVVLDRNAEVFTRDEWMGSELQCEPNPIEKRVGDLCNGRF